MINLDYFIVLLTYTALVLLSVSLIIYIIFYNSNILEIILAPLELVTLLLSSLLFIPVFIFYPYHYIQTFKDCVNKNTSGIINWKVFFGVNTPLMMLWLASILYLIRLGISFY